MSTTTRPPAGDPLSFDSPLTAEQLTELYRDPASSLADRTERVCHEMLTYSVTVGWVARDTRNSGPDARARLVVHLTKLYHRAVAIVPEDVTSALVRARTERGPVSALAGVDQIFSPTAVELLIDLHWKMHNRLVDIASPSKLGRAVLPTLANGHPCGEAVFYPDGFDIEMMARWLTAARAEVVPTLGEWRAEVERLRAEVTWEKRMAVAGARTLDEISTRVRPDRRRSAPKVAVEGRPTRGPQATRKELYLYLDTKVPRDATVGQIIDQLRGDITFLGHLHVAATVMSWHNFDTSDKKAVDNLLASRKAKNALASYVRRNERLAKKQADRNTSRRAA